MFTTTPLSQVCSPHLERIQLVKLNWSEIFPCGHTRPRSPAQQNIGLQIDWQYYCGWGLGLVTSTNYAMGHT